MSRMAAAVASALLFLGSSSGWAAAQRSFVASYGSDGNPCTLAQPCRAFAAAIGQTTDGGEVIVLDSAGYGPVTIAKSVSIISPSGVYAGISVSTSAVVGVDINGAGAEVTLRGLSITGQGGLWGIAFEQGSGLTIEGCEIAGMDSIGVLLKAANSRALIRDTAIRNSGFAVVATQTSGGASVAISNSTMTGNALAIDADPTAGSLQVTLAHSVLTENTTAIQIGASAGANISVLSDGNSITRSNTVFSTAGSGTMAIFSAGNNTVGYYGSFVAGGVPVTQCCGF